MAALSAATGGQRRIQGMCFADVAAAVNEIITEVGLTEKVDAKAGTLSGMGVWAPVM